MLPREIVRKLHRIRIRTNRLVEAGVGGEYHSVFRGRGMEFSEVREYVPGDDVRTIDWNVTARTGVPHVKKFVEERDLTVLLLLDLSASQGFGSQYLTKRELMAELAALLSFAAIKNHDRVGALLFTDRLERYHPPRKGVDHALAITRDALSLVPSGRTTDLALALRSAASLLKQRAVVFVVSDFISAPGWERPLSLLNQRHEVLPVRLWDSREVELPDIGLIVMEDSETGDQMYVDTHDRKFRQRFEAAARAREMELAQAFKCAGVSPLSLSTEDDLVSSIIRFATLRRQNRHK